MVKNKLSDRQLKSLNESLNDTIGIVRLCGKKIGAGTHRAVYELNGYPGYVIKVEYLAGKNFANASEWNNWCNNSLWTDFSVWLAPCVAISWSGVAMIQERVEHKDKQHYPDKIPNLFTDTKYTNFGWIGDRFVCCDYSFLLIGLKLGMKKAKWWEAGA
jgi:hypothetical protein